MYLKTQNDICQRKLEKFAEPLETVLSCLGGKYHREQLCKLWKLFLKNHPHDSICGVSIDDVHSDMENRLTETDREVTALITESLENLSPFIDTSKYENAISCFSLFNTSLRPRTGVISVKDQFPAVISIRDGRGRALPSQRDGKGGLIIGLTEIPALGYQTIFILPEREEHEAVLDPAEAVSVDRAANVIENSYLKVRIRFDGSLEVTDKKTGTTYHELGIFEDGADAGDEYNYSYPEHDTIITSKDKPVEILYSEAGPLEVQVLIKILLEVPEQLSADRQSRSQSSRTMPIVTRMTITAGSPILKFRTEVCNTVKDHRLRVLFPTRLASDCSYAETQFDVTARPINPVKHDESLIPDNIKRIINGARESGPITIFPQRTFVNIHDRLNGLSVLNQGLPEYEILPLNNTIALTLFRGVNWIARPDLHTRIGDAGPMIAVPDAQCLRTMEFKYALYLQGGDWQTAGITEAADEFNTELLIVKTTPHQGPLPGSLGFMSCVDRQGIIKVTAVKRSEDGTGVIVRFHNPTDITAEGNITTFFKIKNACYTDLKETSQDVIEVSTEHSIKIVAQPKKIVTVKLELETVTLPPVQTAEAIQILAAELNQATDFSDFPPVAEVTAAEVKQEEARALQLEKTFAELEQKTDNYQRDMSGGITAQLELSKLQLDKESYHRASLEARLSAILIKKNYLKLFHSSDGLYQQYLQEIDPVLRKLGLELNKARVSKRLLEYIVDYYYNQLRKD